MKRKLLFFALGIGTLVLAVGLAHSLGFLPFSSSVGDPEVEVVGPVVEAGNFTFSGPYQHENLTVFLVHGKDRLDGKAFLTLQDGLASGKAVIHETGDVGQLTVENRTADEELFIQSGDIVKGGKQDRTLEYDLIVPPSSAPVPIASLCVESGRWKERGSESSSYFGSSSSRLPSKRLKLAAMYRKNQGEVWANVSETQERLSDSAGQDVRSAQSSSSLQLAIENRAVQDLAASYVDKLLPVLEGKKDVVGYVFAVNGKINSADVYGSGALFRQLWPRLLKASAIEAATERGKTAEETPGSIETVQAFLSDAEGGNTVQQATAGRVQVITQETKANILFESRDKDRPGNWIHRTYLAK